MELQQYDYHMQSPRLDVSKWRPTRRYLMAGNALPWRQIASRELAGSPRAILCGDFK